MSEKNDIDLSRLGSSNSNSNNTSQNSATVSGSSDTTGESLPVPAPVAPAQLWLGGQLNGGAVYQPGTIIIMVLRDVCFSIAMMGGTQAKTIMTMYYLVPSTLSQQYI